ncbi:cytochrome P450 [Actinoplanes sp. NPDC049265]|uniref:cytochrome P450 n=1 Tax=Actinoplanes sp. NPDC049265 TaxID=3363902 RepID=UPI0037212B82
MTTFPIARTCPFAPPAEYRELRESAAVVPVRVPNGAPTWAVTRLEEARKVLSDPRFSHDSSRTGFPTVHQIPAGAPGEPTPEGQFQSMDGAEHQRYRRLVQGQFTVPKVRTLRPAIQAIVDQAIDDMLERGAPADLVEDLGLPVPSLVICRLLGVPYEDREFFQSRTHTMAVVTDDPSQARAAMAELHEYLRGLVDRNSGTPGDGLIGRLAADHLPTGELTRESLTTIAIMLLVAGHETTGNMIPLGMLALMRDPEQYARLRADPDLIPGAVEELLRYLSIVDWVAFDRQATEDLELGGRQLRAGDGVWILGASANRDERAFDRPDELDVERGARNHIAFGYGIHQCLGQNLARAELEITYRTLMTRVPTLRLAVPYEDLPFKYDAAIFGLRRLPVAW